MATFLAFDFGEKRIGLAVGDSITGSARPLTTLVCDVNIAVKAVQEWRPLAIIVGLPLNEDGSEQVITTRARKFARQLQEHCKLPVHLVDERFSSRSADADLRNARASGNLNRRVKKGDRDGAAACIILEQWLASPAALPISYPTDSTRDS